MDMPINVPVDNPNEDTEWNDILRSKGIIPEKPPSPTPQIEEAVLQARDLAHQNRLEHKTLSELSDLEDSEEGEAFLQQYRQRRLAELNTLAKTSIYGSVYPLQKPDYQREVTDASNKAYVFVLLTSTLGPQGNVESALAEQLWPPLAERFGDIKFCIIRADMCIEGYPERNCPTVLVYKDGDIKKQLVTLKELNGEQTRLQDFERLLVDVGALERGDVRLLEAQADARRENEGASKSETSGAIKSNKIYTGQSAGDNEDDDSDWD